MKCLRGLDRGAGLQAPALGSRGESRGAAGLDGTHCRDLVTSGLWLMGLTSWQLVFPVISTHCMQGSVLAAHPLNTVPPSPGQT